MSQCNQLQQQDELARQQALDIRESFMMQAPAGSGKTEVLTQRFLALLAKVQQPEQILALTFTRKAASEMRYRVMQALHTAAHDPEPQTEPARTRWQLAHEVLRIDQIRQWGLLASPSRLRLWTIDSLCSSIVKQSPLKTMATRQLMQDAQPLYQQAIAQLLVQKNQTWSSSLARILHYFNTDYVYFSGLFEQLLANRDAWYGEAMTFDAGLSAGRFSTAAVMALFEQQLVSLKQHILVQLAQVMPRDLWPDLWSSVVFANAQLGISLTSDSAPAQLSLQCWQALSRIILTSQGELRQKLDKRCGFPPQYKAEKQQMTAVLQALGQDTHWSSLQAYLQLVNVIPDEYECDPHASLALDLFQVALAAVKQMESLMQSKGVTDYVGLAQAAFDALGESMDPSASLLRFDYQVNHILMDEFQDTSIAQVHLFERLLSGWQTGDGRSLFFVGDPMQSIYGFRRADVNLFQHICDHGIGDIKLRFLQLRRNFRSHPSLVNELQPILRGVFPITADPVLHQVLFSEAVPARDADGSSVFETRLFASVSEEVNWIVSKIQGSDKEKCGILVRKKNQVPMMTRALRHAGIAYTAVDLDPLWHFQVVQDLFHLTAMLFAPPQALHWIAVCRAPWIGISLEAVIALAQAWEQNPGWLDLTSALSSAPDSEDYRRVRDLLSRVEHFQALGHLTPVERIRGLWFSLGGPSLLDQADLSAVDAYWDVLAQFSAHGTVDCTQLQSALLRSDTSVVDPQAQVEIMTIHRAKGLEFAHVFVPHLHDFEGRGRGQLVERLSFRTHMETQTLFAIGQSGDAQKKSSSPTVATLIKAIQKQRERQESARLFYVASTRAEQGLYFSAAIAPNARGEQQPSRGAVLHAVIAAMTPDTWQGQAGVDKLPQFGPYQRLKSTILSSLPRPAQRLSHQASQWGSFWVPHTQRSCEWVEQRRRGELLHWWISQVSHEQLDQDHRQWFHNALRGLGWPDSASLVERCVSRVRLLKVDARFLWLLQPRELVYREVAWQTKQAGNVVQCRPDLVFLDDQILWIVDFKTTDLAEQSVQMNYAQQLDRYEQLFQRDFPLIKKAIYLIEPEQSRWIEID